MASVWAGHPGGVPVSRSLGQSIGSGASYQLRARRRRPSAISRRSRAVRGQRAVTAAGPRWPLGRLVMIRPPTRPPKAMKAPRGGHHPPQADSVLKFSQRTARLHVSRGRDGRALRSSPHLSPTIATLSAQLRGRSATNGLARCAPSRYAFDMPPVRLTRCPSASHNHRCP